MKDDEVRFDLEKKARELDLPLSGTVLSSTETWSGTE